MDGAAFFMTKIILFFTLLLTLSAHAKISVVEIPLRIEHTYLKRLPGAMEFFYVGRLPQGQVIAIPESEILKFILIADEEGFGRAPFTSPAYLPAPDAAVSNTAKATVTIEHTDDLKMWLRNEGGGGFWVTWDDDHVAPDVLLAGVPVFDFYLADASTPPKAPQPVE